MWRLAAFPLQNRTVDRRDAVNECRMSYTASRLLLFAFHCLLDAGQLRWQSRVAAGNENNSFRFRGFPAYRPNMNPELRKETMTETRFPEEISSL